MNMFEDLMEGLGEMKAHLAGRETGARTYLPEFIDVRAIRSQLGMTQTRFAASFGFSADAVRHWEAGRRTPETAARALLTVIAHDHKTVLAALHPEVSPSATAVTAGTKRRRTAVPDRAKREPTNSTSRTRLATKKA